MDDEAVMWMVLSCLILAGLTVSVATWIPRQKQFPDWLMVAGGTMVPGGMVGLTVVFEVLELYSDRWEWLALLFYGLMAGGGLIFAMGFVMDRVSRRRVQDRHQFEKIFSPPTKDGS